MSPRLLMALENFRRLADSFNQQQPDLRKLLHRAFGDDSERAADAIRRIERDHDPALAALAWGIFWVRLGDLAQAKRELEAVQSSVRSKTLWGGLGLMMLGEVHIELGETKRGNALLREADRILGAPS